MPDFTSRLREAFGNWWRERVQQKNTFGAAALLARELWGFLRDSTPSRRRQRYGDMDYDWEHRVNTTGGTVGWRERLLGTFYSPYQATDPALFAEMMAALLIDFRQFTFIDVGSGKGRTLLMASEYPFRRIMGVEILPELDRSARDNIQAYKSATQQCAAIEAVCTDALDFDLPHEPLVLYLFNPLPEEALREFVGRLENSLTRSPREAWIVYHNPLLERIVANSPAFMKISATQQYAVYRNSRSGT